MTIDKGQCVFIEKIKIDSKIIKKSFDCIPRKCYVLNNSSQVIGYANITSSDFFKTYDAEIYLIKDLEVTKKLEQMSSSLLLYSRFSGLSEFDREGVVINFQLKNIILNF